jgi:hypothetical protein
MFNENLPNKEGNCPLQNERQGWDQELEVRKSLE